MSSFFSFIISLDEKKGGIRAANEKAYDWQSPHSQGKLDSYAFPDFEPKFSGLILSKKSVQSDIIQNSGAIGGKGIIISKKVKELFKEFNLPPHKFYSLDLLSNPEEKLISSGDYFWMQILLLDFYDWIDFHESKLSKWDDIEEEEHEVELNDKNDLVELFENYEWGDEEIRYTKLVLTPKFLKQDFDLFYIEDLHVTPIISERLKNRLEESNVTGLQEFDRLNITVSKQA